MSRRQSWLFLLAVAGLAAIGSALTGGCKPNGCKDFLSLMSSANPSTFNQAVTFTVQVLGNDAKTPAAGVTVTFLDGVTMLGVKSTDVNGNATLTISTLTVGDHFINVLAGGCGKEIEQTVKPAPLTITTASPLPTGQTGQPYSQQLAASGGTGTPTWSLASGSSLPAGLTLSTAGLISGTPSAASTFTFTVVVTDQATPTPQRAQKPFTLTINALGPIVNLSPTSLTFAPQTVGIPSLAQSVTLTNSGNATLLISSITITGANSGDFTQTNSCAGSVTPGSSCAINVTFAPTATGMRTASVTITDTGLTSPDTVSLTGTGVTPVITEVSPNSGQQGATLNVAITGQSTHFAQGMSMVGFSGTGITVNSVTVADATHLAANLTIAATAPPGAQTVTVLTGAELASLSNGFTVTATACALNGQYAFLFQGWDSPTDPAHEVTIAGSFTVASGSLTSGVEDINRFSGVSGNVAITGGSCTVGTGNRGVLILITSLGTTTYHFTVDSTLSKGEFIEFDDIDGTGTRGSGFFEKQDTTAFSAGLVTSLDGDKAFGLQGNVTSPRRLAAVGRFTLGSGTINRGEADVSRGSSSGGQSTGQLGLTGSFTAPDATTGRGGATLMLSFTTIVPETYHFSYYIISAAKVVLLQTDNRNVGFTTTFSGLMRQQTPSPSVCLPALFCNASLNGRMVFAIQGAQTAPTSGSQPTGNPSVAIGLLGADGGGHLTTSIFDQNDGGTITHSSFGGDYAVAADGLGRAALTLSFTTSPPFPPTLQVAYLTGVNEGFIMDAPPLSGSLTEAEINFGEFKAQAVPPLGGFSIDSLKGTFRVNSEPPPAPGAMLGGKVQDDSGLGTLDGVGTTATSFDLMVDISDVFNFLHSAEISGTYSFFGLLGNLTTSSSPNFACWIIAPTATSTTSPPGEFACISTTAADASTPLLRFRQ